MLIWLGRFLADRQCGTGGCPPLIYRGQPWNHKGEAIDNSGPVEVGASRLCMPAYVEFRLPEDKQEHCGECYVHVTDRGVRVQHGPRAPGPDSFIPKETILFAVTRFNRLTLRLANHRFTTMNLYLDDYGAMAKAHAALKEWGIWVR